MTDSTNDLLNQHQKIIDAYWADWYRRIREEAKKFHERKAADAALSSRRPTETQGQ